MPAAWDILPRTSLPATVPLLLVKYKTDGAGYNIHLTDLTYIWSESLSNEQIIQRSLDEETSIEPKDDSDQLRILLAKIGDSLRGSDETSLDLLPGDDGMHLRLNILAHLPSPFRPLQWPIRLTPLDSEALRAEILIPLLANQQSLKKQVASLLVHIKEKDNVILKLKDKLESSGVDTTMIFPGAAVAKLGKRVLGREMASKVLGLAPFNEDSWRKETLEAEIPSGNENELITALFPSALPEVKRMADEHHLNAWWSILPRKPNRSGDAPDLLIRYDNEHARTDARGNEPGMLEESMEHDIEDEFERQATPPSLVKHSIPQSPEALGGSLDAESKRPDSPTESPEGPTPTAYRTTSPPRKTVSGNATPATSYSRSQDGPPRKSASKSKKLGLVGGRVRGNVSDVQQAEKSEALRTSDVQLSEPRANDLVVESNDHYEQTPHRSLPSTSTSTSAEVKHRLGIIGGKRKNVEGDVPDTHTMPATSPAFLYRPIKERVNKANLNMNTLSANLLDENVQEHHKKSSNATRTSSSPGSPPGTLSALQTRIPPPAEGSQERADRKRAELRKVLEEKAKAPTQKRRRF